MRARRCPGCLGPVAGTPFAQINTDSPIDRKGRTPPPAASIDPGGLVHFPGDGGGPTAFRPVEDLDARSKRRGRLLPQLLPLGRISRPGQPCQPPRPMRNADYSQGNGNLYTRSLQNHNPRVRGSSPCAATCRKVLTCNILRYLLFLWWAAEDLRGTWSGGGFESRIDPRYGFGELGDRGTVLSWPQHHCASTILLSFKPSWQPPSCHTECCALQRVRACDIVHNAMGRA